MNVAFDVFSPQQWRVLQALSLYRYLTVEQMLRLGISKNAKSLRDKSLFALRQHRCIQSEKIGSFLPDVHHLTKKGVEILNAVEGLELETAPSQKRAPFSALFAAHRFAQVDFHIGLRQWADERGDAEVLLELQDFQHQRRNGGQSRPATELTAPGLVSAVIPDGLFAVGLNTGQTAVYVMEIHRATQSKAVTEQLARYCEVITSGAIGQAYGYAANPVICSVHHQPAVLASVKRRLLAYEGFEKFHRNFVFHALGTLTSDFTGGWHFADDQPANPFPLPHPAQS